MRTAIKLNDTFWEILLTEFSLTIEYNPKDPFDWEGPRYETKILNPDNGNIYSKRIVLP